jgi:hypothetical protein
VRVSEAIRGLAGIEACGHIVGFATTYNYDQSTATFDYSYLALFDSVELC